MNLAKIIAHPPTHAKWLNTLSFLENCGAKLMADCEHPTLVREEMLKHAAEEFRHAYLLKSQIAKIYPEGIEDYRVDNLLGRYRAYHYMKRLNVGVSRLLKQHALEGLRLKGDAYTLVSYAIEVRAHDLYPEYQHCLIQAKSRVSVRSIILEEEEHLQEMKEALSHMANGKQLAEKACQIEETLWKNFINYME